MRAVFLNENEGDGSVATVRLDRASIDAVARQVMAILRAEALVDGAAPLTAADVAAQFGVSRAWVYENADRLDVMRLGDGAKPRLRFDRERVRRFFLEDRRCRLSARTKRSNPQWLAEADLIPIRGH